MIPAKCRNPACGAIVPFPMMVRAANVHLSGNTTRCTQCGSIADVVDGHFGADAETLVIKQAPQRTIDIFAELQRIADKAKAEKLDTAEILAEVAEVSPELADNLRKRGLTSTILVLLLITLVNSCSINVNLDLNKAIEQGLQAIYGSVSAPIAAPPAPQPRETKPTPDAALPTTTVAMLPAPPSRRARRRQRGRAKSRRP